MSQESTSSWVCLVCGYTHHGDAPPEQCPVCGATSDSFERQPSTPSAAPAPPKAWRCVICGYIHQGGEPPDECPVCGASSNDFEAYVAPTSAKPKSATPPLRIVVVGAGIAGVAAAEAARETSPDSEIVLISAEDALPYYRINLSRYLANEITADTLPIHPGAWYADKRIRLLRGKEVQTIGPNDKTILFTDGTHETYDRLVLTCGAHPFVPPFSGASRDGVVALRTLDDTEYLLRHAAKGNPIVCIGGGILGLEMAGGLAKRGAAVTVLESFEWLLPRQLDPEAGGMLEQHAATLGIAVRYQAKTAAIEGNGCVTGVRLEDGAVLPATCVAIATGVRANTHLARAAGLTVNQGLVVDNRMATSHPDIFAAGDVAEHQGVVYGLWEPARMQGVVAGTNAAGGQAEFAQVPRANTLKVLGLDMFSVGVVMPTDGSFDVVCGRAAGVYSRYVFQENRLVGAVFVGDTKLAGAATAAVRDRREAASLLQKRPDATSVASWLRG